MPLDDAQLSETTARGGMPGSSTGPIAVHFVTEIAELWLTSCCRLRRIAARATEPATDIEFIFVRTRAVFVSRIHGERRVSATQPVRFPWIRARYAGHWIGNDNCDVPGGHP